MKTNLNRIFSLVSLRICLYVMLVMFASCSSCKKELTTADLIAQLPPETQTGANTFGCLIDGKPFVPTGTGSFTYPDYPVIGGYKGALPPIYYNRSNVYVSARQPYFSIDLYIRNVNTVGIYKLNFDTNPSPNALYPQNYGNYTYATSTTKEQMCITKSSIYTGQVEITKADTTNGIVSGRFSFKAINTTTGKIVDITDGRFDVQPK